MSQDLTASATIPSGAAATPVSILQAISGAIGEIEKRAEKEGLKPVWDQFEIDSELDHEEELAFASLNATIHTINTLRVTVLAIDPKEVTP